jgi:hypothetical protein
MIGTRAARIAARLIGLLALLASASAQAQSDDSTYSPPLREAIAAYRAGDLDHRREDPPDLRRQRDPDAEAWLGVVLLDRGNSRKRR